MHYASAMGKYSLLENIPSQKIHRIGSDAMDGCRYYVVSCLRLRFIVRVAQDAAYYLFTFIYYELGTTRYTNKNKM